ncbi:MAG: type II toxin-antitoxin system HicB family antitoxin [Holosporales bacterium]|jgi:predicted RNase H-like HicB family nuclease|nr:type II toxin-antitoxin system HicB family antitoxin [Holosporales bacterium]
MTKKEKKLKAVIEKGKDGLYSIYILEISGLFGTGETEAEAKESLNEAIDMALEYIEETGIMGDYAPLKGVYEIEYLYDLSGFFKTFDFFDVSSLAKRIGINPSLMRRYKSGISKASVAQKIKISEGIQSISQQLSIVNF